MKVHILDYLKALSISTLSFFLPIVPLILLVGLFILCDTILGIWAAIKRGERITSRKLGNIVPKMLLYQGAVLVGYVLDHLLLGEFVNYVFNIDMLITKLIAMTLIFIESVSLNENMECITGKNIFKSFKDMITRTAKIKGQIKDLD
jgi:hypothetical protein